MSLDKMGTNNRSIADAQGNKFSVSLLFFWIKGSMLIDDNTIHIDMPNTAFFGLIPTGKKRENLPFQAISNVSTNNYVKISNVVWGVIFALAGFGLMQSSTPGSDGMGFPGFLLLLVGIIVALAGIKTEVIFERSGLSETIAVPFFESGKLNNFAEDAENKLQKYQVDRNNRIQNQAQTSPNNASVQANATENGQKFCPKCGTQVTAEAAFCTKCGYQFQ